MPPDHEMPPDQSQRAYSMSFYFFFRQAKQKIVPGVFFIDLGLRYYYYHNNYSTFLFYIIHQVAVYYT